MDIKNNFLILVVCSLFIGCQQQSMVKKELYSVHDKIQEIKSKFKSFSETNEKKYIEEAYELSGDLYSSDKSNIEVKNIYYESILKKMLIDKSIYHLDEAKSIYLSDKQFMYSSYSPPSYIAAIIDYSNQKSRLRSIRSRGPYNKIRNETIVKFLKDALKENPRFLKATRFLAEVYFDAGKLNLAMPLVNKVIKEDKSRSDIHILKARIYIGKASEIGCSKKRNDFYRKSLISLKDAKRIDTKNPVVSLMLSNIYSALDKSSLAMFEAKQYNKLTEGKGILQIARTFFKMKKIDKALGKLKEVTSTSVYDEVSQKLIAKYYFYNGQFKLAVEHWDNIRKYKDFLGFEDSILYAFATAIRMGSEISLPNHINYYTKFSKLHLEIVQIIIGYKDIEDVINNNISICDKAVHLQYAILNELLKGNPELAKVYLKRAREIKYKSHSVGLKIYYLENVIEKLSNTHALNEF